VYGTEEFICLIMKDFEFINYLVRANQYLTTDDEKAWYRTALCAALNWGRKIDREQAVYGMAHKCKSYKK
jgi:hypothetical protein